VIKHADDEDQPAITDFAHFARTFLDWPDECLFSAGDPDRPLPDRFTVALPAFGETLAADLAFQDPESKDPANPWIILVQVVDRGVDLDRETTGDDAGASGGGWTASPSRRFERLLRESGVPIGLLCNATHLRLMYAPRGENAGSITFPVAFMAGVAGRPIVSALELLLHQTRLLTGPAESRLPALLRRSREFQARVSVELAQQVIDAAFELLRGLQAANGHSNGDLLKDVLVKEPSKVYEGLLTVLMRLVFVLYAEDRGLMPGGSLYQQHYSVHGLFERLRGDDERNPDTMDQRYGAWAHLLALFRAIYGGCRHPDLAMPARDGYLFDPGRFPFLEGRPTTASLPGSVPLVPDGTLFRVLRKLLILYGERLSYRTLDVEQIGSVYEVMMGFGVGIAAGPSIAIKHKKTHGAPVPINLEELLKQPAADRATWLKAATDQELSDKPGVALKAAKTVDDLLAALEQGKKIARSATPAPVPTGEMLLVPSDERRRSGSNYTPRSLTEPIVRKTLEPVLRRLGDDVTADQILELKVCDPAMGSGAFMVEACRQLAEVLVKAWHRHKQLPTIPPDEDELLYAKRLIAQRCLYGVDKNPMATDLAKLSMWLATLARDHPFTFLDHSFRAGDSLVGLTKAQIASFTWEPGGGVQKSLWAQLIEPRIEAALAARREILVSGDFMNPETKRQKLAVADEQLGLVRFIGDLAVAAFFAGVKPKQRVEKRQEYLQQLTAYLGDRSKLGSGSAAGDISKRPQKPVDAMKAGEKGVTPFHWEIEFPEVFGRENPGFDAIVGNPPFLGGTRVSSEFGMGYFNWLTDTFPPAGHLCDLVAYFLRRAFGLLHRGGCFGLIATNTVAQGDTREGGLTQILSAGGIIFSAQTRYKWPGEAAVTVCVVHFCNGQASEPVLDGKRVSRISAYLVEGEQDGSPHRLAANPYFSAGSKIYGQGFVFDDSDPDANPTSEMTRLFSEEPKSKTRVRPYMGGEEINSLPSPHPIRYVITASDLETEADLMAFPRLAEIIRSRVKPERDKLGNNPNNVPLRRRWWAYQAHRPELYAKLEGMQSVIVNSQVSSHLVFAACPTNWVFAHTVNLFCLETYAGFVCLQARPHALWAKFFASSLEDRLRYTPSDCFETFPFPENFETNPRLEAAGQAYYEFRAALMVRNNEGLTKTYNRFHDPEETSLDILQLRDLHATMDRVVLDAYTWTDIPTACEFLLDYEEDDDDDASAATSGASSGKGRKKRKPYRYRWPDAVRDEVLARLLALNAKRAEEERLTGAAAAAKGKPAKAKKAAATEGAAGGLFKEA